MALKFYAPVEFADTSAGLTVNGDLTLDNTSANFLNLDISGATKGYLYSTASVVQLYGGGSYLRLTAEDFIRFDKGSANSYAEAMRLDGEGRLGIGTTSPTSNLHLNSSTTDSILQITNTSTGITSSDGLRLGMVGLSAYFLLRENAAMLFSTNNTERMRIANTGNVLIGTTTDSGYKLEVNGKIATPAGAIVIEGQEIYANSEYSGNDGSVRINRFGYLGGQTRFRDTVIYDGKGNQILTVDGSTSNVGIGTTSPEVNLHVFKGESSGAAANSQSSLVLENNSNTYLQFLTPGSNEAGLLFGDTDNDAGAITYSHSSNTLSFRTAATSNQMIINSSGNVGIGTTSPSTILDVGDGQISGVDVLYGDSGGSLLLASYDKSSLASSYIGLYTANGTASGERMRVTSGGNVLIGTTTDSGNKLYVNGTGQFGSYALIGTTIAAGFYMDSNNGAFRANGTSGNKGFYFQSYNGGATRMYIGLNGTYAGNIGVGTTAPSYNLDVSGSFRATTLYGDGSNLTGITATETDTLDSVTSRGSTTSNAIGVGGLNVDSGTLYVDSTNNRVGIGTTAPASTLMVHSTGSTAVGKQWQTIISDNNTLAADRGGGIIFRGRYSGTQPANFCGIRAGKLNSTNGDANAYLSLLYGAAGTMTEGVRVNYNGNVLIGTTTDSGYKLEVDGDVNASGDYYAGGTQGYTGTVTIQQPSPQPPINIDIQGGIITNVY
jgi:hypothetical protein